MGLRATGLAAIALASGALAAGCGSGTSQVTLYPFNNAKGSEIAACKASTAKERTLSPALRNALEASCAHPNPAAIRKVVAASASKQCQAGLGAAGLPATLKSTVPLALQQQALARCPKS